VNKRRFPILKPHLQIPVQEKEVLKFWQKNQIFQQSLKKNRSKQRFVFFEGPPTANAAPGIHHVEARAFKDLFLRYKTMRGFLAERKAGWDTHGLPVEIAVEKELGFSRKEEIEKFGIARFNALAKKHVWGFKDVWERLTERIAFWLDLKDPYITYQPEYIETLWWIIKQIWEKKLLYKGHKVVPHCPRCGTALSSHEVALGYREIEEDSIFVKFKVKGQPQTYLLAWTTTPWTLPGNVALAVNPAVNYLKIKLGGEQLILAEALAKEITKGKVLSERIRGQELIGLSYEPLFPGAIPPTVENYQNAFRVYGADFVTTDEGTGVVHTAVMYGEDDYQLGDQVGLPKVHTVDEAGRFLPQVRKWAGRFVKDKKVEQEIVEELRRQGLLFKTVPHTHDYPFCWRCETPLLYYAKHSWFIRMSAVKRELLTNNRRINWIPAHIKEGRFGEWLSEVKDWAISRERYWGTPLPIWENEKGELLVVGSFAELRRFAKDKKRMGRPPAGGFDPHRPLVDEIILVKGGREYRRIPEVIDVWFDSGAMPFAQWHYPFRNKERIDKRVSFPADFIAEGVDQTRGWFYTLLAISTLLGKGPAYKNVISLGHVLDKHGKKMSKSKGNVVDPQRVIDQFGADALRFYFYSINQPGLPKNFDVKDVEGIVRNLILRLWNSLVFFTTYVHLSSFRPKTTRPHPRTLLDRWMLAVIDEAGRKITQALEEFNAYVAAQTLLKAVDDFSNWYLRRSRKRFLRNPESKDEQAAYETLYFALKELALLSAPFTPFLAESLYQALRLSNRDPISIHLCNWSVFKAPEKKVLEQMGQVRAFAEEGLRLREEAGIRVRQPLGTLYLLKQPTGEARRILADEINVKRVKATSRFPSGKFIKKGNQIALDTEITPALAEEGLIREVVRFIQQKRKESNLTVEDPVKVGWYSADPLVVKLLEKRSKEIERETASRLQKGKRKGEEVESRGLRLHLQVSVD